MTGPCSDVLAHRLRRGAFGRRVVSQIHGAQAADRPESPSYGTGRTSGHGLR